MDIYMVELRITADEEELKEILETEGIRLGSKSICHASVQLQVEQKGTESKIINAKLDSCGSVSIAHGNLLNAIKTAKNYKLPNIRLRGIGGKTNMLTKAGILKIKRPNNECCEIMCYVFNEVVGQTEEMLLISLSAIINANINILYHIKESNKNTCQDLQFWPDNNFLRKYATTEEIHKIIKHREKQHPRDIYLSTDEYEEVEKDSTQDVVYETYIHD
jgi:hypothetical protein